MLTGKAPSGAFLVLKISVFYNSTSSKTVIFGESFSMRIYLSVLIGLAAICAEARAQKLNHDFEKLHLLVGTWRMETSKGALYETWQKVNDSTLSGHSYRLNGKDTVVLEQVDLIRRKGNIQYIPVVKDENNNEAVIFTLSTMENDIYTFENSTHDFPQKVVYTLPADKMLYAWIEGNTDGKLKRIDYRYTKLP